MNQNLELSIVMPCLNEAETLGRCIEKANAYLERSGILGEVVVADNGSTDGSIGIAESLGARVVHVSEKGYGNALKAGIGGARGRFCIMGDSDDSYDFSELDPFVSKLREGYDIVVGNRFRGGIKPGAMPFLHKYLGNPVLSFLGKFLFRARINDFHCGLRGFRQDIVERLNLRSPGMEFASEMIVKSSIYRLKMCEVPTVLSKDGRSRPPHLRTWRDGWRHFRFLLIYSPKWLFLYPGLAIFFAGMLLGGIILKMPLRINNVLFDTNTLLYAMGASVVGFQLFIFWLFTRKYATQVGLLPESYSISRWGQFFSLENLLRLGVLCLIAGLWGTYNALASWQAVNFGKLDYPTSLKQVIPSVFLIIQGVQLCFSSFFMGVLDIIRK
jgi:glycosyltransferase involved in cell wall biosynthesis